jgi:hypothetical protein
LDVPDIFMSYRRVDSIGTAGRLFDRLAERFGADQVFRDVDSIEAGENFVETIRDALRLAVVVLIVIGPRWLDARREDGTRRIDDPADYVRREIEIALSSGAVVIPLLVEGAVMPAPESLPPSVRALARHNDWELSNPQWYRDTREFLGHLEGRFGIAGREPAGASSRGEGTRQAQSLGRAGLAGVAEFVPGLLSLLTQPRRFLARHARGRPSDLLGAVIFLLGAQLLSVIVLGTAVRLPGSVMGIYVGGVVWVLLAVGAISIPFWLAWRLAGAARHYPRLIGVLLYQAAVVHLVLFVIGAIMATGFQLGSKNSFNLALAEAFTQESTISAFKQFAERISALAKGPEIFLAAGLSMLVALAGGVWLIRSWGAYRDAFGLSRRRSVVALLLILLACWSIGVLVGWLDQLRTG